MLFRKKIKRKIVIIGDPAVGKTSILEKFVNNKFSEKYKITFGTNITRKTLIFTNLNDNSQTELVLMFWDIMGQKEYRLLPAAAYQNANGAILICDLTRKETLNNLPNLTAALFDITPKIPIIFIGNKHDLATKATFGENEMSDLSIAYKVPYFLTSARTGENVDEAFKALGKMILNELDK